MKWRYFQRSEFACKCGCSANRIDDEFVSKLDELRDRVGFPMIVTSGYRCPAHNARVSPTGPNGPHTTGRAVDIRANGQQAHALMKAAFELGLTGIGVKQHGGARFVHLDDLELAPRPNVWSYP